MMNILQNISNTINNSRFLTIIVTTAVITLGVCFISYIIKLLSNIRSYIVNKSNSFYLENMKNQSNDNSTLPMPDRIELTDSILDLITFVINNEITSHFQQYIALNTPYEVIKLDDDVKEISTIVFNSLNKAIFTNANTLLTESYLMSYITKKTINTMVEVSQAHNANIRGAKQSTED